MSTARAKVEWLDHFGRWILDVADPGLMAVIALAATALIAGLIRRERKTWPTEGEVLKILLAFLGIPTALSVGAVLVLTDPPAINSASRTTLVSAGLVAFIFLLFKSLSALGPFFEEIGSKKEPAEQKREEEEDMRRQLDEAQEELRKYRIVKQSLSERESQETQDEEQDEETQRHEQR